MSATGAALSVSVRLPLRQFTLECNFEAGREVVVLFGHSGSGKTSVLDCIAGFRRPEEGEIALSGRTLFSGGSGVSVPVRRRRIGYLSQQPALFPHLSVRENIEYGLLDMAAGERKSRVDVALERFRIGALASNRPAAVSGGEQQRVALARALVCEPELLLLDEPLSALDLTLKAMLVEMLFEWQRERAIPMLYVTHDQQEAYSLSRRVLVMEKGKIVADGEPAEVFSAPASVERAVNSGYENIFEAVVEETHAALGTMTCRVAASDLLLESPLVRKAVGEKAALALRAGDILVATERPTGLSARNILSGQIEAIEDRAGMVELRVRCGRVAFRVHITRGSLQSLALRQGQAVWLIIKTHSIQFVRS